MDDFRKGQLVFVRDFPLGRPTNIKGRIVGILSGDFYNVLMISGLNEGKIMRYKSWKLYHER